MNHTERNDRVFYKITQLNFRIDFDLNAKPFRGLGERLIGMRGFIYQRSQ